MCGHSLQEVRQKEGQQAMGSLGVVAAHLLPPQALACLQQQQQQQQQPTQAGICAGSGYCWVLHRRELLLWQGGAGGQPATQGEQQQQQGGGVRVRTLLLPHALAGQRCFVDVLVHASGTTTVLACSEGGQLTYWLDGGCAHAFACVHACMHARIHACRPRSHAPAHTCTALLISCASIASAISSWLVARIVSARRQLSHGGQSVLCVSTIRTQSLALPQAWHNNSPVFCCLPRPPPLQRTIWRSRARTRSWRAAAAPSAASSSGSSSSNCSSSRGRPSNPWWPASPTWPPSRRSWRCWAARTATSSLCRWVCAWPRHGLWGCRSNAEGASCPRERE